MDEPLILLARDGTDVVLSRAAALSHCGTLRVMYMYQYYICMLGH